jgi:hypothetical protein
MVSPLQAESCAGDGVQLREARMKAIEVRLREAATCQRRH